MSQWNFSLTWSVVNFAEDYPRDPLQQLPTKPAETKLTSLTSFRRSQPFSQRCQGVCFCWLLLRVIASSVLTSLQTTKQHLDFFTNHESPNMPSDTTRRCNLLTQHSTRKYLPGGLHATSLSALITWRIRLVQVATLNCVDDLTLSQCFWVDVTANEHVSCTQLLQ